MRGPHPHAFPKQDHVLFILYKALQALDALHRLGQPHGSLCDAHIYIARGIMHRVKLGFAASVVDLATDTESDSASPYMPSTSVCMWAAAPEASAAPTVEGDVWLLGITALELAYGGLRITSGRELESIVTKINVERGSPRRLMKPTRVVIFLCAASPEAACSRSTFPAKKGCFLRALWIWW